MTAPWPEDTQTSAIGGGGDNLPPESAYRGLPDDVALAAAVCDAIIWEDWGWPDDVLAWQEWRARRAERPPVAPSGYDALLVERGWTCAQDVFDAAHVTAQQAEVVRWDELGWDHRAIAAELGISAGNSRLQLYRAKEK